METTLVKILRHLRQPSTWQGITAAATAFGVVIAPGLQEGIIAGAALIIGLIQIVRDEDKLKAVKQDARERVGTEIRAKLTSQEYEALMRLRRKLRARQEAERKAK